MTLHVAESIDLKRNIPRRTVAVCLISLAIAVMAAGFALQHFWPFSRDSIARRLAEDSGDRVTLSQYRPMYFPHPGCIADDVVFQRDPSSPRLTLTRLTIQGSYAGLLHHYIPRMLAEGALLKVPQGGLEKLGSGAMRESGTATAVGVIELPHARVDIDTPGHGTITFQFDKLRFESVTQDQPFRFAAILRNPIPAGDLQIEGQAGPFHHGSVPQSPISGSYTFSNATLDGIPGVGGSLSSQGKFRGPLEAIQIEGTADSPDFFLKYANHSVNLHNQFRGVVTGTNGDVHLEEVQSHYGQTIITSVGSITSDLENGGKIARLEMSSSSGRIQDLLRLFVAADPPSMTGAIVFHAHVVLPNEQRPFLKKLRIQGDFAITNAQSTNTATQQNVEILSARGLGQADKIEDDQEKDRRDGRRRLASDLHPVAANVRARVSLEEGVARLSSLSFGVPGVTSELDGTYSLLNQRVHLGGTMHMQTRLSHATTGVKSVLARIIQPRTHKPGEPGSDVAVQITGTYGHPSFAVQPATGGK